MAFEPITYWSEVWSHVLPTARLPLSVLAEQCTVTEGFHTQYPVLSNLCAGFSAIYRVFDSLLRFVQKTLTLTFRDRSQFRRAGEGLMIFRTGGGGGHYYIYKCNLD